MRELEEKYEILCGTLEDALELLQENRIPEVTALLQRMLEQALVAYHIVAGNNPSPEE
ncbi:MAG: hypothetical protein RRY95_07155 [Oscillospiraceae bacterium]